MTSLNLNVTAALVCKKLSCNLTALIMTLIK